MAENKEVFKRYEKKYMLNQLQYEALRKKLEPYMVMDEYGRHTICNLYLDTWDYALIRQSIEKPVYKEKLRLRSYGIPKATDKVFLEIKKKYDGIVYKRRISMPLQESMDYLCHGRHPRKESQIQKEIEYFLRFYKPEPKVFIGYDRIALFGRFDAEQRITFDSNIRFRTTCLDLSMGDWGTPLLPENTYLMEIKIIDAMPVWLSEMLSDLEIYPASFSKYGNCYKKYLIQEKQIGGMDCAS